MEPWSDTVVSGLGKSLSPSSFLVPFHLYLSHPCMTPLNSLDNSSQITSQPSHHLCPSQSQLSILISLHLQPLQFIISYYKSLLYFSRGSHVLSHCSPHRSPPAPVCLMASLGTIQGSHMSHTYLPFNCNLTLRVKFSYFTMYHVLYFISLFMCLPLSRYSTQALEFKSLLFVLDSSTSSFFTTMRIDLKPALNNAT